MSILVRTVCVCKDPWIWIFGEKIKIVRRRIFGGIMSYPMNQLGARGADRDPSLFTHIYPLVSLTWSIAFNHNQSSNAEAEYDRLRSLARQEHNKRASLSDRVWLMTLWKAHGCWCSSVASRPVEPTNREMEQQLMSYQRRAGSMGN